jgi:hypothetical protein
MRTTLDIDDDVLAAAKELARRQHRSVGKALSDLARQALTQNAAASGYGVGEPRPYYGFEPFPSRGTVVTNDRIDRLRDESGA